MIMALIAFNSIVLWLTLHLFYCTGTAILSLRQTAKKPSFALPAILGMLLWIAGYAIFQTGSKTVMWLLLPLLLVSGSMQPKNFKLHLREAFRALSKYWLPVLMLCVLFAVKATLLFDYESLIPDNAFYARIAEALSRTGQENEYHFLADLDDAYKGVSPYHYGELWLASAGHLFGGMQALLLFATPLIAILFVQALFELMSNGNETKLRVLRNYVLALLVAGSSWLLLWPLSRIPQLAQYDYVFHSVFCFNTAKFGFPALLAAAAFLSYRRSGRFWLAGVWLCSIAVASYTTLPAVCGAWLLCVVWHHFALRRLRFITLHFWADLLPLLIPAGIVLFYMFVPGTEVSREGVRVSSFQAGGGVGMILKIFAAGLVAAAAFLLPYVLALGIAVWPQRRRLPAHAVLAAVFACGALGAGAAAWGLLNTALNSVQLMSVCSGFLAVAAAVWVGVAMGSPATRIVFAARLILLVLLISGSAKTIITVSEHRKNILANRCDSEFMRRVEGCLRSSKRKNVGFLWSQTQYRDPFHCYPHFSIPYPEAATGMFSHIRFLGMGEMNRTEASTPQLEAQCQAGVRLGLFYRHSLHYNDSLKPEHRLEGGFYYDRFLWDYDINYVFAARDAVVALYKDSYELIAEDPNTGLRFFRSKHIIECGQCSP
jgi:hypothetical protein